MTKVFVEVYESTPFPKLKLLARARAGGRLAEGRIVISGLRREDFEAAGADEPYSEGIIDHLRSVDGAETVALVRELPAEATTARKGSLRSHPDGVDVSAIARSFGGGGHKRAAGFSTDLAMEEITRRIVEGFRRRRRRSRGIVPVQAMPSRSSRAMSGAMRRPRSRPYLLIWPLPAS